MKTKLFSLCLVLCLILAGCGSTDAGPSVERNTATAQTVMGEENMNGAGYTANTFDFDGGTAGGNQSDGSTVGMSILTEMTDLEAVISEKSLSLTIGNTSVTVEWEDNESVDALRNLVKEEPLTVQMSMYSTFEQVGSLGTSLPRNDVQTTTRAGDIVLYSGNQIVVFYGSNSWAYTRLGKITDKTASELKEMLSNGDVVLTISVN